MSRPYRLLGISLCVAGAVFAPIAYFVVGSAPLASVGLSAAMIGFASMALANSRPYLSPEAAQMMLKTGMENTASLIEELGLKSKAVYVPSAARGGKPQALIPLSGRNITSVKGEITGRLIVRYGPDPADMAIAVATPGSMNVGILENKPGPTSDDIQSAASYVLVGVLDIARSVNVSMVGDKVVGEVSGARVAYEDNSHNRVLGSPIASILAAITCEALGRAVRVESENFSKGNAKISLEVLFP